MDRIVLFTSYYFAVKAEKVLQEARVPFRLIATPPVLEEACGLCILFHHQHMEQVVDVLVLNKISHSGMYVYRGAKEPVQKI